MKPKVDVLTRVDVFDGWYAKRDDKACFISADMPSGSKVRQYLAMAKDCPKGTPMVVGCSASSAQQVYVADAAKRCNTRGIVFVPARAKRTRSTQWAIDMGAEVHEVRPGYPSVYRSRAKEFARGLGGCVRWNPKLAVLDTAVQTNNLPSDIRRVIVPTGSGLVAAGVLVGLAGSDVKVIAVAVSSLASKEKIIETALKYVKEVPRLEFVKLRIPYEKPMLDIRLPDGDILDPFYAAKAMPFVKDGDCLWVTGCRGEWKRY